MLGVTETEPTLVQDFTEIQVYLRTDHPALKGTNSSKRSAHAGLAAFAGLRRGGRDARAVPVGRRDGTDGGHAATIVPSAAVGRRALSRWSRIYIEGKSPAAHGEPWECDTHVPLLMMSFGNASAESRVVAGPL